MLHGFNFTERVRRALAMAREEAASLHHEYVGTEHMLLGLVREGGGVAIEVLRGLRVDPQALAWRIGEVVRAGRAEVYPGPDLPYTSRAKKVLELAMNEARELNHSYVGTEHLLLGLIVEGKGIAAQVLAEAGITLDAARSELVRLIGTGPAQELAPKGESGLGDLIGAPLEQVEVILHYRDGRPFKRSFSTAQDAIVFLRWADVRDRPP
jgi:ATP-dependent Clp protease ATP-binding subunit ClpC